MTVPSIRDIYWRIQPDANAYQATPVSLIMPGYSENGLEEFSVDTEVNVDWVKQDDSTCDLAWSSDDFELFISLLTKNLAQGEEMIDEDDEMLLDFEDAAVRTIVHIVAAKRFNRPIHCDLITPTEKLVKVPYTTHAGDIVSIQAQSGFKLAAVVKLPCSPDHERPGDATVVLLDLVSCADGQQLDLYTSLEIPQDRLLPAELADSYVCHEPIYH